MAKYKIEFNKDACIGCGACASVCGDVFELDEEEMKAHPKKTELDEPGCAKDAEEGCPVDAIKVVKQ